GIPFGDVLLSVPGALSETLSQINVDHSPTVKDQIRYRFNFERQRAEQPGSGNQSFDNLLSYNAKLFSTTWVHTFGPSVVNDLRLAYRRLVEDYPLKDATLTNFPNILVPAVNLSLGPNQ